MAAVSIPDQLFLRYRNITSDAKKNPYLLISSFLNSVIIPISLFNKLNINIHKLNLQRHVAFKYSSFK